MPADRFVAVLPQVGNEPLAVALHADARVLVRMGIALWVNRAKAVRLLVGIPEMREWRLRRSGVTDAMQLVPLVRRRKIGDAAMAGQFRRC